MKARALAGVALLAALLTACGGDQLVEFSFPEDITAIVVTIDEGSVVIDGDGPDADATVDATARGSDPQIDVSSESGVLTISHTCGGGNDCSVDYAITLPEPTASVEVTTGKGTITVVDIEGAVTLNGADGDIALNGVVGDVSVELGRGSILGARLESVSASFSTEDGDIDVSFDEPVDQLDIATAKGNATTQLPGEPYKVESEAGKATDIQVETSETSPRTISIKASEDVTIYAK